MRRRKHRSKPTDLTREAVMRPTIEVDRIRARDAIYPIVDHLPSDQVH
jgi:hypothetical protein